jgi:hypothetical protein
VLKVRRSIASMIKALSVEFFPAVLLNCWMGWMAYSRRSDFQPFIFSEVQSP